MAKKSPIVSTAKNRNARAKEREAVSFVHSVELLRALNTLNTVCLNTSGLVALLDVRVRREEFALRLLSFKRAAQASRAKEQKQRTVPFVDQWDALEESNNNSDRLWNGEQDAMLINQVRSHLIEPGLVAIDMALREVSAGGAWILECANEGNRVARGRSMEIHVELQYARELFLKLSIAVSNSDVPLQGTIEAITRLRSRLDHASKEIRACLESPRPPFQSEKVKTQRVPKTSRGLMRCSEISSLDLLVIHAIEAGGTYREVAKELGVSKSTVGRICQAFGLTGHTPLTVPLGGTLDENLTIRHSSRMHKRK